MSKFEVHPGWSRRLFAVLFAVCGVASLVFTDRDSTRVSGAVLLLAAWELAFLPSLPFNFTLGQVYHAARQGWRMSIASRLVNYASVGLIILSIYLRWHGR